jgi:hypothetical protein
MTSLFEAWPAKVLRNREDVADIIQEALMDVYENASTFDPANGSVKAGFLISPPIAIAVPIKLRRIGIRAEFANRRRRPHHCAVSVGILACLLKPF